jgi:acetyl esterase/lipase
MPSEEYGRMLDVLRSQPRRDAVTLGERRAAVESMADRYHVPSGVSIDPVGDGPVRGEFLSPSSSVSGAVLLYVHGGAYIAGSPRSHRALAAAISESARTRTFSIEYRLAPECAYPAAVDDVVEGYSWLVEAGIRPDRIALVGDSSGGGLAVTAMLRMQKEGMALPAAAALLSPWIDLESCGDMARSSADRDPIVHAADLRHAARAYLRDETPTSPDVNPLHADLSGLPPLLIHVGTSEILLEDACRFAARAGAAGVEVTLEVWPDMIHVWHILHAEIPEARSAVDSVGAFVQSRLCDRDGRHARVISDPPGSTCDEEGVTRGPDLVTIEALDGVPDERSVRFEQ